MRTVACAGNASVQITYCCIVPFAYGSSIGACQQSSVSWDAGGQTYLVQPGQTQTFGFLVTQQPSYQPGVYGVCYFNYTLDFQVRCVPCFCCCLTAFIS